MKGSFTSERTAYDRIFETSTRIMMGEGCQEPVPTTEELQKPCRFQDSMWLQVAMSSCPSIQTLVMVRGSDFVIWLGREVISRQQ